MKAEAKQKKSKLDLKDESRSRLAHQRRPEPSHSRRYKNQGISLEGALVVVYILRRCWSPNANGKKGYSIEIHTHTHTLHVYRSNFNSLRRRRRRRDFAREDAELMGLAEANQSRTEVPRRGG